MAMELTIHRENGFWTAHIGELFHESQVYPLIPESKSLYLLVKAIESTYPKAAVWIDPRITDNPFLSKALFFTKYHKIAPDYERIQFTLEHPGTKQCGICGGEGWYNCFANYYWHVGWWECTHCQAREASDGEWYKLTRFARR